MTYEWKIAGKLEQPIAVISLHQFLGEVHLVNKMTKIPFNIKLLGKGISFLESYKIYKYITSDIKIDSPFYTLDYSSTGYMGIAVTFEDKVIGNTHENYTYIDDQHRGKGIGTEILSEFHVAYPIHSISRKHYNGKRVYTNSGLKSLTNAYNLLLEREAILGA